MRWDLAANGSDKFTLKITFFSLVPCCILILLTLEYVPNVPNSAVNTVHIENWHENCFRFNKIEYNLIIIQNTYPFQWISGIENNRRQNDIEKYLWIESSLQIDFILFWIHHLSTEWICICFIRNSAWYRMQFSRKLKSTNQ